ncbi:hypothetical protein OAI11_01295, partial [Rhodospirillales bacterium]|nr:hypothetical protein [Rhodospirillales bacterium]
ETSTGLEKYGIFVLTHIAKDQVKPWRKASEQVTLDTKLYLLLISLLIIAVLFPPRGWSGDFSTFGFIFSKQDYPVLWSFLGIEIFVVFLVALAVKMLIKEGKD